MRTKGRHLGEEEIQRVISLLKETDLSLAQIATRMQCSRGVIATINHKYSVRDYGGKRVTWKLIEAGDAKIRKSTDHSSAA
jgi:hypothetical protein